jgi:hypothetical protein
MDFRERCGYNPSLFDTREHKSYTVWEDVDLSGTASYKISYITGLRTRDDYGWSVDL